MCIYKLKTNKTPQTTTTKLYPPKTPTDCTAIAEMLGTFKKVTLIPIGRYYFSHIWHISDLHGDLISKQKIKQRQQ